MIALWVFLGAFTGSVLGLIAASYIVMRFGDE